MLVYTATKSEFASDILNNQIVDKIQFSIKRKIGRFVGQSEANAFRNSLRYMETVLQDSEIPSDCGISIEYQIPQTGKRIDFIVSGVDTQGVGVAILVELKQWQEAKLTKKDGVVTTFINGSQKEVSHPSYQAWSYAALLEDFNETVRNDNVQLKPCAYLHNYAYDGVITDSFYSEHLLKAPIFLKPDAIKLRDFIKKHVKSGDVGNLMYRIDHGRIRPSKSLADKLLSLLQGNKEFVMIDDQKVVFETALALVNKAQKGNKQVLIVQGGPGTGKSVVAINLLVELINREFNARYITKNAAPRAVYESMLTGTFRKTHIANLFSGSGSFTDCKPNTFDALIVDEAHRLNLKSGLFQNKGENQIKEIIHSANFSIFFIDEDQKVTLKDIGDREEIVKWALKLGANVFNMELSSQFRCNGSDGYLSWLDNALQVRETANTTLEQDEYDFRIVSSPNELRDLIINKNKIRNKARLVAGYCWDWVSKPNPDLYDINILEHSFSAKWNLASDGNLWILQPDAVNEVGCIHTCQGLELDYIGVIVGEDLICRDGKIITNPAKRAKTDGSVKGFGRLLSKNPELAQQKMDLIIKNTYRTLMTRGMKGCYVYFVDKETEEYFRSRLEADAEVLRENDFIDEIEREINDGLKFTEYLPIYSLEAACGNFGEGKSAQVEGWVRVSGLKLSRNMFVSRVRGKSMEPRIMDNSLCVFRAPVVGSRQNKIVLVQHNSIADPDNGGKYTVKKYSSKKRMLDDEYWEHEEIVLKPLNPLFDPIVIPNSEEGDFIVIAELMDVL